MFTTAVMAYFNALILARKIA